MVMQIKRSVRWVKVTTAGSALPCAGSPKKPHFSLFKVATFRMGVSSVAIHVAIAALHKYVYFLGSSEKSVGRKAARTVISACGLDG
jgi:hypothetical protein